MRDLLDRTDDGVRAVRPGRARAAGSGAAGGCAAAVRRSGRSACAHCGATGVRWPTGPRARSATPAITALCRPRACVRRAGRRGGCFAIRDSPSRSAVTARALTMITSARGAVPRKRSTSGGCAPAACLTSVSLSYSATQPNAPVVVLTDCSTRFTRRGRRRTCSAGSPTARRRRSLRRSPAASCPCSHETLDRLADGPLSDLSSSLSKRFHHPESNSRATQFGFVPPTIGRSQIFTIHIPAATTKHAKGTVCSIGPNYAFCRRPRVCEVRAVLDPFPNISMYLENIPWIGFKRINWHRPIRRVSFAVLDTGEIGLMGVDVVAPPIFGVRPRSRKILSLCLRRQPIRLASFFG